MIRISEANGRVSVLIKEVYGDNMEKTFYWPVYSWEQRSSDSLVASSLETTPAPYNNKNWIDHITTVYSVSFDGVNLTFSSHYSLETKDAGNGNHVVKTESGKSWVVRKNIQIQSLLLTKNIPDW